jgi:hypothetical protein
MPKKTKARVG